MPTLESIQYIRDLFTSPAFSQAMKEFLQEQIDRRAEELRNSVRVGDIIKSALAEGQIMALETLIPELEEVAGRLK